jgi:hypothetical protein
MMTAPGGKGTTEEASAPPERNDPRRPADATTSPDRLAPVERITVSLIPKAGQDLQELQDRTNLSKTDIVNRAIILYEFIEEQLSAGQDILIRDKDTGETQLIRLM